MKRVEKVKEILDKMLESDYHPTDKEVVFILKQANYFVTPFEAEPEWVSVETKSVGTVLVDEQNVEIIKKIDAMTTEIYQRATESGIDVDWQVQLFSTILHFLGLTEDIVYVANEEDFN